MLQGAEVCGHVAIMQPTLDLMIECLLVTCLRHPLQGHLFTSAARYTILMAQKRFPDIATLSDKQAEALEAFEATPEEEELHLSWELEVGCGAGGGSICCGEAAEDWW